MAENSIHLGASEMRYNYREERWRQDNTRCLNILLPFRIISARLGWAKTLATRNTMRAFFGLTKSVRRALFRNPTNSLVYMSRFSWMKAALSKWVQDLWVQLFKELLFCLSPNKPLRECFILSLERWSIYIETKEYHQNKNWCSKKSFSILIQEFNSGWCIVPEMLLFYSGCPWVWLRSVPAAPLLTICPRRCEAKALCFVGAFRARTSRAAGNSTTSQGPKQNHTQTHMSANTILERKAGRVLC